MMLVVMVLEEELRRFAKTTSLKGVGRAYTSSFLGLRLLWGVCVLGCSAGAAVQCYYLLIDYLNMSTVSNISQLNIASYVSDGGGDTLPDITVCNLNPISSTNITNFLDVKNFYEMVENRTSCNNCSREKQKPYLKLRRELLNPRGYFQYVGTMNGTLIGHQEEALIADCLILLFDGYAVDELPCGKAATISLLNIPSYFNCYHISTDLQMDELFVGGFSLVLHLDNTASEKHGQLSSYFEDTSGRGALVLPHISGTWPWMGRSAIHVSPGTQVK